MEEDESVDSENQEAKPVDLINHTLTLMRLDKKVMIASMILGGIL